MPTHQLGDETIFQFISQYREISRVPRPIQTYNEISFHIAVIMHSTALSALSPAPPPQLHWGDKGVPCLGPPLNLGNIAAQGWNLLRGDVPLPLAVLKRSALQHNLNWMRQFAEATGLKLAPHGKTTMSPELWRMQIEAGAWGITFANVQQAVVGVRAGVRRCLIANQVVATADLNALHALRQLEPELQVCFWLDSEAQLRAIESWAEQQAQRLAQAVPPFEVLLEVGVEGGRCGCRTHEQATQLARAAHQSAAVRLRGVACYEGLSVTGTDATDRGHVQALMLRVEQLVRDGAAQGWFDGQPVLLSAGGSALFDLVAPHLRPHLGCEVEGVLRAGCTVTHDHGVLERLHAPLRQRLRSLLPEQDFAQEPLHAALEVWAQVLSVPEPDLAILNAGKRDLSYDQELPRPLYWHRVAHGQGAQPGASQMSQRLVASPAPTTWRLTALNDQHAYLRGLAGNAAPSVGDLVGLGISHPCTTFDKWRWLALVDDDYNINGAVSTCF